MAYKDRCERCGAALPGDASAFVCSYDCTFCAACARALTTGCPNCGGELVARPRRAAPARVGPVPDDDASTTHDPLTIRRARPSDAEAAAELFDEYRQFYREPPDRDAARRFLAERAARRESVVYLAFREGRAVGFLQLYPTFSSTTLRPLWILNDLFVARTARRHGVGGRLLERAKALARETGAVGVTLETATDNPAQRLYEAHGWKRDVAFLHYEWNPEPGPAPDPSAEPR